MKRCYQDLLPYFKKEKILFISGPRQVGKTTLTKAMFTSEPLYLNWDIPEEKEFILKTIFTEKIRTLTNSTIILDEIHKYNRWKSALKGISDRKLNVQIFVTGSAKLDVFQKGGDSLFGRFEHLRIHPFTIGELIHKSFIPPPVNWFTLKGSNDKNLSKIWTQLELNSGFPEPYIENSLQFYTRWSARRRTLLTKEDVRDIADIKLVSQLEELVLLLPTRVGSLLSLNSLAETLRISHESVQKWLVILEHLYLHFQIKSYQNKIDRALTKSTKLYLWDWSQIEDVGPRLENMVAVHLLKSIHIWNDLGHGEFALNYIRNKEKNEIDFIITNKRKAVVAIEVKNSDESVSNSWFEFDKALKDIPKIQLLRTPNIDKVTPSGIRLVSCETFLSGIN